VAKSPKLQVELSAWCVIREEWSQDAALHRVADWGVVERVDGSGHAENVREEDELLADGMGVHIFPVRARRSIAAML
jgi:hypothetical protein